MKISVNLSKTVLIWILPLCVTLTHTRHLADAQSRLRGMNVSSEMSATDVTDLDKFSANVVRYQLSWGRIADTASEAEYNAWLADQLVKLDALLPVYRQANIKIILNLHTPPGGFSSVAPPLPQMRIFSDAWAQQALLRIWDELAQRYANEDQIVAYQLVSEPATGSRPGAGLKNWYDLQRDLGKVVRKYDRTKYLVVSAGYSSPAKLKQIRFPRGLGKALHCINFYAPISFLRQGVELPVGTQDYPTAKFNRRYLQNQLSKVAAFQAKNRASIFVAEFTTSRFGPAGSDVRYLTDLLSLFERFRWHWTFHAWREAVVWSIEHASSTDPTDPTLSPTRTARANVLESFFARNR